MRKSSPSSVRKEKKYCRSRVRSEDKGESLSRVWPAGGESLSLGLKRTLGICKRERLKEILPGRRPMKVKLRARLAEGPRTLVFACIRKEGEVKSRVSLPSAREERKRFNITANQSSYFKPHLFLRDSPGGKRYWNQCGGGVERRRKKKIHNCSPIGDVTGQIGLARRKILRLSF